MARAPKKKVVKKKKKASVPVKVQDVLAERNLVISPTEPVSAAPVVMETEFGKVRIEGEVTPAKMALAKQFDSIFQAATTEIEELALYVPNPKVLELIKAGKLSKENVEDMKTSPPWSVFSIDGLAVLKTPDNKLESVQEYCFRLEKAVLAQVQIRKQSEEKSKNTVSFLQEQIDASQAKISTLEALLKQLNKPIPLPEPSILDQMGRFSLTGNSMAGRLILKLKELFAMIKSRVFKFLSEEKKGG